MYSIGTQESRSGGKGVTKFRKPTIWSIENKILYGLLFATDMEGEENMKIKDFADKIGISERRAQAWIFEGEKPSNENIEKICDLLGYPEEILFYDIK